MSQKTPTLATIHTLGTTFIQQHNPIMIAWWSAVFPGFGHYLLNQYVRATLLTLSEVFINTFAHINEAMVFSFCGKFEQALLILEPKWAFGYLTTYLVTIWDSYRSTLYQNKLCHIAYLENHSVSRLKIIPNEIQYIERKKPFISAIYSFFFPGLGQLYNHQVGLAFYAMFWWWIYITFSNLHEAILTLVLGSLADSSSILHPHWLLFMPSVLGGSIYQAYVTTIGHNKLYRIAQRQHLTERYRQNRPRIFK